MFPHLSKVLPALTWGSFSAYLLDMAGAEQRPIYLAVSGVLTSPLFLSSILVGGLFELVAGEAVFAAALALSAAGVVLAWTIPRAGVQERVAEEAARA